MLCLPLSILLASGFGSSLLSAVNSLKFSDLQVRIGVIYLISGFGGSVLSALFLRSNYISVGASGALFGLLGSMLSELIMNWTIYSNKVRRRHIICVLFCLSFSLCFFFWAKFQSIRSCRQRQS